MKKIILITLILATSFSFSQSNGLDYLVTFENDTINCKVLELKNKKITYIINGEKGKKKKNIFKFADLYLADSSIIENPLNIKIEEPEDGYAHVYFYRPFVYTGAALPCKVEYNGKLFINIKTHSYYLHKIKAGEIHKYNQKNLKKEIIEIDAKNGEIYFIRGSFGGTGEAIMNNFNSSNTLYIFQDNAKIAEHLILTMKKVSPAY